MFALVYAGFPQFDLISHKAHEEPISVFLGFSASVPLSVDLLCLYMT